MLGHELATRVTVQESGMDRAGVLVVVAIEEYLGVVLNRPIAAHERWVPVVTGHHFIGPLAALHDLDVT